MRGGGGRGRRRGGGSAGGAVRFHSAAMAASSDGASTSPPATDRCDAVVGSRTAGRWCRPAAGRCQLVDAVGREDAPRSRKTTRGRSSACSRPIAFMMSLAPSMSWRGSLGRQPEPDHRAVVLGRRRPSPGRPAGRTRPATRACRRATRVPSGSCMSWSSLPPKARKTTSGFERRQLLAEVGGQSSTSGRASPVDTW